MSGRLRQKAIFTFHCEEILNVGSDFPKSCRTVQILFFLVSALVNCVFFCLVFFEEFVHSIQIVRLLGWSCSCHSLTTLRGSRGLR